MKITDPILTRHVIPFIEAVTQGDYKTNLANNAHVLKCAVDAGIIEDLTRDDIDNAEPWRIMTGDLADLAIGVSDAVADSLKPPDPN